MLFYNNLMRRSRFDGCKLFMRKKGVNHTKTPKYPWVLIFFVFVGVFFFVYEYIGGLANVISDPIYVFSLIMVGLLITAPVLWILNEGKRIFLDNKRSQNNNSELFKKMLDKSDEFTFFQNLKIDGELFDVIAVGPKSITVIVVLVDDSKITKQTTESLEKKKSEKILFLKKYFSDEIPIAGLITKENNDQIGPDNAHRPNSLSFELNKLNPETNKNLDPTVLKRLQELWGR